MILSTYVPGSNRVVHETSVDFSSRPIGEPVHLVQYDDRLPILAVSLYKDGVPYQVPQTATASVRWNKPGGKFVYNPALGCNSDRTIVYVEVTVQMVIKDGLSNPIIEITEGDTSVAGSGWMNVYIDKNPVCHCDIENTDEYKTGAMLAEEARKAAEDAEKAVNAAREAAKEAKAYYMDQHLNIEALEEHALLDSEYEKPIPEDGEEIVLDWTTKQEIIDEIMNKLTYDLNGIKVIETTYDNWLNMGSSRDKNAIYVFK